MYHKYLYFIWHRFQSTNREHRSVGPSVVLRDFSGKADRKSTARPQTGPARIVFPPQLNETGLLWSSVCGSADKSRPFTKK
jgi:hypothetical protein